MRHACPASSYQAMTLQDQYLFTQMESDGCLIRRHISVHCANLVDNGCPRRSTCGLKILVLESTSDSVKTELAHNIPIQIRQHRNPRHTWNVVTCYNCPRGLFRHNTPRRSAKRAKAPRRIRLSSLYALEAPTPPQTSAC